MEVTVLPVRARRESGHDLASETQEEEAALVSGRWVVFAFFPMGEPSWRLLYPEG